MISNFFKKLKVPHVFALLTWVILFCCVLTYIIPSGSYEREERTVNKLTRTMVKPGTFETFPKHYSVKGLFIGDKVEYVTAPVEDGGSSVEGEPESEVKKYKATPVSLVQFLSSIPRGMEGAADIIFFIFIIGGVFGILQRTGTITAVIHALVRKFSNSGPMLTIILMVVIAVGGSTLGMGEEFIPLVPIFLFVSKEMGYDRIYGLALVMLAADIGFAAATTNPFTIQIAQGIAEVPLGSGIGFRLIFFAVVMTVTLTYVLRYGNKIRRDPSLSIMKGDEFILEGHDYDTEDSLSRSHIWVVISSAAIFGLILYAVQKLGWWLPEMAGGFLLMGAVAVLITKLPISEATKAFVKGTEEMVVAALVVGFAKGIQVVLMDGQIMDTLIYYAAQTLQNFPSFVAAEGMLVFQTILNFFIPSGSGQAATTMPLMAPLSDVLGVSRQTAVFAFTCGDGFSNTIVPTSGVLMAMLSLAGIPYEKWLKFVLPLFLQLIFVSAIFLAIAVWIGY